jgi:hypothetical protein
LPNLSGKPRPPLRVAVTNYDALRDYLKQQKPAEFVLSFDQIEEIIDAALPRAAHRASWWETLRSPQEKMPQREACLEAGYIATRLPDGKNVRFTRMKSTRRLRESGDS